MRSLFILALLLSIHTLAASFTENLYRRLGLGSVMLEDLSSIYTKSVSSAKRIAACPFGECCIPEFVTADFKGLHRDLCGELFGQHLVIKLIVNSMHAHFNPKKQSGKPLVISLQGQSGTGKTYVAEKIARFTYKLGLKSEFVHHYIGRSTFTVMKDLDLYKERIAKEVKESVKKCPKSMFIFDEVDKMPQGIFDSMASILNHNPYVDGVDYREATFVFISNTYGYELAERLQSLEESGILREDTKLSDFEQVLKLMVYNGGALVNSSIIEDDIIDHYVPFLPLEKKHVIECIRQEFGRHKVRNIDEKIVNQIATDSVTYYNSYSVSGCKRIDKLVALHASELYTREMPTFPI